jgi:hypothetical protein
LAEQALWPTFSVPIFRALLPGWYGVFIHLMYLVNFQSRVLVFIQWAIQDLTFSRGARLNTGAAPTDFNFTEELSEVRAAREIKPQPVNVPR